MTLEKVTRKMKKFFAKEQRYKLVMIVGIVGISLIFLSDIMADSTGRNDDNESSYSLNDDPDEYAKKLEKKLESVLEEVSGVGDCSVMVTVSGTTEYVYAENIDRRTDTGDGETDETYKNEIVFTEQNGEKEALVKKVIRPQINGVIVVCSGGGDVRIKERVIKAVSTLLGVSSDKICVEGRNPL